MKYFLSLSIIIFSSPILAADFWADRLGGGAEEVFIQSLLTDDYTGLSNQDIVQPTLVDDELVFDIHADSEAIVAFSEEVLPSDLTAVHSQDSTNE